MLGKVRLFWECFWTFWGTDGGPWDQRCAVWPAWMWMRLDEAADWVWVRIQGRLDMSLPEVFKGKQRGSLGLPDRSKTPQNKPERFSVLFHFHYHSGSTLQIFLKFSKLTKPDFSKKIFFCPNGPKWVIFRPKIDIFLFYSKTAI